MISIPLTVRRVPVLAGDRWDYPSVERRWSVKVTRLGGWQLGEMRQCNGGELNGPPNPLSLTLMGA